MSHTSMSYKRRADQRGEIEMPPLDYQMPSELGGTPQVGRPVTPAQEPEQQVEQQVAEQPEELNEIDHTGVEGVTEDTDTSEDTDEPEVSPTKVEPSRLVPSSKAPKTQQENFKEVRMAKERAERERDALMSQMLNMQSQLQNQQQQQQVAQKPVVEEKEWYDDLDPESLVEGKQVQRFAKDLRAMKMQLREQQAQSQEMAIQSKIKSQYPDFDVVFNADNINILNEQYPDVANALRVMPDDYNKATAAYTMIKNLGISNGKGYEVKKPAYESDILKAKVNAAKPRPLASVSPQQGDSPMSKANAFANGLTPELKEQLRKEMAQSRKAH